jgi:tRNA A-37 threonylcarbamoyl transferase component Bud32
MADRTLPPRAAGPSIPEPGTAARRFGDYEILEEVARGGMGVVYKARQLSLNRTVALKMILSGQWATPEARQRFRAEAESAAILQHPNIVAIHEVGEHDGQQYFSMDFVAGKSLAELVREKPLSPEQAASYVKTTAQAVQFAHDRGILHRDLKPQNVLIDSLDCPRITDFGLAKQVGTDSGLTRTGDVLGSPSYMPPEQASGEMEKVGPQSDVYSLGAILYELLTGQAPFRGATALETLCQVIQSPPVPPRKLNPAVPRELETICLKCMEKSPANRFASAQELADELERFLHGERILSSSRRLPPLRPWIWLGSGAVLGAVACAVASAMDWLPKSLVATDGNDRLITVGLGTVVGCITGAFGAGVIVVFWNTLVLPASLLRYTTAPLAKAALGLGLVINGLVLAAMPQTQPDDTLAPHGLNPLQTAALLLEILGPILCLEIAPKVRSSGILLSVVALQASALVLTSNRTINELKGNHFHASWAALAFAASVVLFLVFLARLAHFLERPDLEKKTRSILKWLIGCLAAVSPAVLAGVVDSFFPGVLPLDRLTPVMVMAAGAALVVLVLIFRLLLVIYALQSEITQRL